MEEAQRYNINDQVHEALQHNTENRGSVSKRAGCGEMSRSTTDAEKVYESMAQSVARRVEDFLV
jgi:hypothetical protein